METIEIHSEYIRLDQALKLASLVSSGAEAKLLVRDGRVRYNGEVCTMRGKKCRPGDTVSLGEESFTITRNED